jgi:methylenetetrahydrofolate dehydrogenase (NADP+)/methenyltetrahydrofolate cyclohydrolase
MAMILDGKVARDTIREELKQKISKLRTKPTLVILQVGDRPDSSAYIKQKKAFASAIGAQIIHEQFAHDVVESVIIEKIEKYNADANAHGILLQIPIPEHLNKEKLLNTILPEKDVDGLTAANTKLLFDGKKEGYIPATTLGVLSLIDYYKIPIDGKKIVMIGRSTLVGKPTAMALLNRDATVIIAHKHTKNLKEITKSADILVVAIGDPQFISKEYVNPDQTIIDIGINLISGEKLEEEIDMKPKQKMVGDVNFQEVEPIVKAISPVPGGVGPMTVASLFLNLFDAYTLQSSSK